MKKRTNPTWKFTNGTELNEKEFLNYIEKKMFKTIRRFEMLKNYGTKEIPISASDDLNTKVLNYILATKFSVKFSSKPPFSSENLSDVSEENFLKVLDGKFKRKKTAQNKRPLYLHSDKEIQLYARLKRIKGTIKKRDKRIQALFAKFMAKNPDLEHNVVNAFEQLE
jgi:hypothetical protein